MGKLRAGVQRAQQLFAGRLNGVIGVYGPTGAFLGGDNAGNWVNREYSPQNNHHVEALLVSSMLRAFGNAIPDGSRVYLFCHYSPCQECLADLLEYPGMMKRVGWKLGFHTYYAPPSVNAGEGLWPDRPAACRAVYRLILRGWSARQWDYAGGFTKPPTPLRYMRFLQHAREDVKAAIRDEPNADTKVQLYSSLLKEFVDKTLGA